MLRTVAVFSLALFLSMQLAQAEQRQAEDRVGDVYEIRLESVSEMSGDGSSGSSSSRTALRERVIALRDDGVELEFDLPEGASPEDRAGNWQFPARVLAAPQKRSLQLLNAPELESRLQSWLELGGFTQASCGRWIFTWKAFKIECDPQSVLETLAAYNLRLGELRAGALYNEAGARAPAPLQATPRRPDGQRFVAEMEIDPDAVRRERAETDVVVAELMGREPLALETALQPWAARQISGTITTTLETDSAGRVVRRTKMTNILTTNEDGSQERQTSTVTVERRLTSR